MYVRPQLELIVRNGSHGILEDVWHICLIHITLWSANLVCKHRICSGVNPHVPLRTGLLLLAARWACNTNPCVLSLACAGVFVANINSVSLLRQKHLAGRFNCYIGADDHGSPGALKPPNCYIGRTRRPIYGQLYSEWDISVLLSTALLDLCYADGKVLRRGLHQICCIYRGLEIP